MKQDDMRLALIDSAIHVVALKGIHQATTKALSNYSGINEVYIYRLFNDKEDLFAKAFAHLDNELITCVMKHLSIMKMSDIKIEDRCWMLFAGVWRHVLSDYDKCAFFIHYYYSQHYNSYPHDERKKAYSAVVEGFRPAFKAGTDVWGVLNHILDVMFSSAVKIIRGEMPNDNDTAAWVFNLLYLSVEPALTWTKSKTINGVEVAV